MIAINVLGALAIFALTAACGNTADGAKKDAENAAEKTAEAASTTGSAVGGALETGQVKSAIMADTRVDAGDINVDTDEDKKTVTLKGTVKTDAERVLAGEIAIAKAVGYSVKNDLTVKP
ncbi:MAG: BON domain-containing protein [Gemmatimonas sp.]